MSPAALEKTPYGLGRSVVAQRGTVWDPSSFVTCLRAAHQIRLYDGHVDLLLVTKWLFKSQKEQPCSTRTFCKNAEEQAANSKNG